jgi:hypothetical protein
MNSYCDVLNIVKRSLMYLKDISNIVMRSLIHIEKDFEYRDEENPHTTPPSCV